MAIELADVSRAAYLARIGVLEAEAARYVDDLSHILDMADQLASVDTDGIEPLAHPLDAIQPMRRDEVTEINHRDDYQASAPAVADGLFLVPRVVE